ncbi:MAG TPA: histidine kinase [Candidatus Koribacter sp.]
MSLTPLLTLAHWMMGYSMRPTTFEYFLIVSSEYLGFAALAPPLLLAVRRWPIRRPFLLRRSFAYVLAGLVFVSAAPAIRCLLMPPFDVQAGHWAQRNFAAFLSVFLFRFPDHLTAFILTLAAVHAVEFYERNRIQEIEQIDLRRALAENDLALLKTQLHPHFLFNTLQGISSLTEEDPPLAKKMVVALGRLLREALNHSSVDLIPLQLEMEFIHSYLAIEKMRLGERLTTRINIPESCESYLVPQLFLQPLVENAISHGISASRSDGWLCISCAVENHRLIIRITNSVGTSSGEHTGLGLRNTRARLHHLFSDDASLTAGPTTSGVFEAIVTLPAFRADERATRVPADLVFGGSERDSTL